MKIKQMIIIGIGVIFLILLFLNSVGTVGAGERGVLLYFGAVQDKVFNEGLYFKTPFVQNVQCLEVKIQKEQTKADAASKDLQIVTSTVALNFYLLPEKVNKIWQLIGKGYKERIIAPSIQETVKSITARYSAEELITQREIVKNEIRNSLKERLGTHHIIVTELSIVNFDFSPAFNRAIEDKQVAEQEALKASRILERVKIEAEQRIAEAQGKAQAIKVEAEALKENPQLVELRWVEKWDGKVPQYWGQASPFIGIDKK